MPTPPGHRRRGRCRGQARLGDLGRPGDVRGGSADDRRRGGRDPAHRPACEPGLDDGLTEKKPTGAGPAPSSSAFLSCPTDRSGRMAAPGPQPRSRRAAPADADRGSGSGAARHHRGARNGCRPEERRAGAPAPRPSRVHLGCLGERKCLRPAAPEIRKASRHRLLACRPPFSPSPRTGPRWWSRRAAGLLRFHRRSG